jgi:outer membrane protein assembly factor BamB
MRRRYYTWVTRGRTTRYRGDRPIVLAVAIVSAGLALTLDAQPARPEKDDAAVRIVGLDPRWTTSFESAPAAPAGFDQQMAYLPLRDGQLVAVDLDSGATKWTVPLVTTATPTTGDGLIFAASESELAAFDQRTGDRLWAQPLPGALAAPMTWDAGWLFASSEAGELFAFEAHSGSLRWRQPLQSPLAVPPASHGDHLYVALRDDRLLALDLASGATAWTYPIAEAITGMLALDDQLLVGTRTNLLRSLALNRGRIRWAQKAGADIAGAPAADDNLIYFAALDNVLRGVDRRSGNLRWTRPLPARPAGGPLRAGNVVLLPYVTTDVDAFLATTGVKSFTIRAIGELASVPYLRDPIRPTAPLLIAMSREGALQGFASRFEPPPAQLGELPGIKVTGEQ